LCVVGFPTVVNNAIAENSADAGGGICWYGPGSAMLANNTIVGNSARYDGGGVSCYSGSTSIANMIVAFNSSGIAGADAKHTMFPVPDRGHKTQTMRNRSASY
jgi:hypothetical protein